MTRRAKRWIIAIAVGALVVGAALSVVGPGRAWAAGLATSEWPMFHRDALHTGASDIAGPLTPETRWFQGGAAILPFEANHVPHGPQGAIWSSAATSEVNPQVAGAKKVWYFHYNSWTGRGTAPPTPGDPLTLRSEFPDESASTVPITPDFEQIFESSAAMPFTGATGETLNTLIYRNRDPFSNPDVVPSGGFFERKLRIPAGMWTFDFWITNVPAATNINFTVYSFPQGDDQPAARQPLADLDPVIVPIPATPDGALRRIIFVARTTQDTLLEPDDGVAIGVRTDVGGSASLVVEGGAPSRVETPIEVAAVYAGADDGSVWAFDASTGNVLWSYRAAGALFRSSPAVGDDGTIYIGSTEGAGLSEGRLYAFNPNGTVKWTYPAVSQTLYFRSGYLAPDIPGDFPAGTAPLYPGPGSGTDPNSPTVAQTGTETGGDYVRFVPASTNAVVEATLPANLTTGWLAKINPTTTQRTMGEGSWTLNLALRAQPNHTADAVGFINYRISKVEVGPGPSLVLVEELLGWTQYPQALLLPLDRSTVWANIQTPSISETPWTASEYAFIELAVSQVATTGIAAGGWQFLLEGEATQGGPHSQLMTPGLSEDPLAAISSSPVISDDDVVYVATHGGEVHAVEAADGQVRWTSTVAEEGETADELRSSPALGATGTLYIGSMNGRLYALDGDDGQILWRFPLAGQTSLGAIESSPALDAARGHIYFGSNDGNIYCVQPMVTGENQITPMSQWSYSTGGAVTATPAIGADGTVYVGSLDHRMYALTPGGTLETGWPYLANGEIHSSAVVAMPRAHFYFLNQAVEEDPSRLRLRLDPPEGPQSAEISCSFTNPDEGTVSLPPVKFDREFRTRPQGLELAMPGVLPSGAYGMNFWARASVENPLQEEGRIFFKVFHCTPTDAEGRLLLTFPQQAVTTAAVPAGYHVEQELAPDEILGAEDYLRVEVWASATLESGSSGTVFFGFDGQLFTNLETPAQQADTALVYFASSVVRADTQTLAVGRVYCLDQDGGVVWIDPNPVDPSPGYNPRDGAPPEFTAFTASPALWDAQTIYEISDAVGNIIQAVRRREPVLYLGGQDAVMYAFGAVAPFMAPPPMLPPEVAPVSVLALSKRASPATAEVGGLITYTLRYRNAATVVANPAENAIIQDPLPTGVDFIGASDGGQVMGGAVTWTVAGKPELATIWPGQTGQVTFEVRVREDVPLVPPLGEEGSGLYAQPLVSISTTDPMVQPVTTPNDTVDFTWGQPLYVRIIGLGKPAEIVNSAQASPAIIFAQTGEQANAAPVTVYAGWGKRYRLSFRYDPANDPDPMLAPDNQPISYSIDLVPPVSAVRTNRTEETVEATVSPGTYEGYGLIYPLHPAEDLGVAIFKVHLQAQGRAAGRRDLAVTDLPNRAWTPYYWTVEVQQAKAGAEEWGPRWRAYRSPVDGTPTRPAPLDRYDFMIHNPLQVTPPSYALAWGINVNPATQTNITAFSVANISKQALMGVGRQPRRNVVRWEKVDLAQSDPLLVYDNPDPRFQFRDENYLPENALHIEPDYLSLAAGQGGSFAVWGKIPNYLSPAIYDVDTGLGGYRAPNPDPAASDMPIYVDLDGNLTWDVGEVKFEDAAGGTYNPFAVAVGIAVQPWVRFDAETVDYAKAPPGVTTAAPVPALLNLGNTDLAAVTLDPRHASGLLPLQRSDLAGIGLRDWRETMPLWLDLTTVSGAVAKTPVGWPRPSQQWLLLPTPLIGWDQPFGAYSGPPDAVSTVAGITTRDQSPFKARVVERRLTGYDWATDASIPGADITPWATWVDNDTLRLFWSSNSRADRAVPTSSDPYWLHERTFDRTTETWSPEQSYPDPDGDPMDLPAPSPPTWNQWVTKQHVTPGHGFDADGTEWLMWGGSTLRPNATGGHFQDNRLLWSDWPATGAIEDFPAVAGSATPETDASDLFRLHPQPVFFSVGGNEYNYVVLSEHSTSQPWQLGLRYRWRSLPGGAWSAWGNATLEAIDAASGLAAAREPSALLHDGYLWVVFSGVSSYHANYDIFCARYDPGTLNKAPFARVVREPLEPDASLTVFASRHKQWQLSTPVPVLGDIVVYVAGIDIGGTGVSGPDGEGWCTLQGTAVGDVEFHPGQGVVRFGATVSESVELDYTPRLLRLSTSASNESDPCAFMETYRYRDDKGTPDPGDDTFEPAGYEPRLWVFWIQEGVGTGAAEIMYVTMREQAPSQWIAERAPRQVPVDHAANELGLCAVKDPRYAQVWLFWSSSRGAPSAGASGAAADIDLYYQAFAPELP